jgi:hypothetical protein
MFVTAPARAKSRANAYRSRTTASYLAPQNTQFSDMLSHGQLQTTTGKASLITK